MGGARPRTIGRARRVSAALACATLAATAALAACGGAPEDVRARVEPLPLLLSQTGLYADPAAREVDPRNRPFAPQYPLWTDGATKKRWVRLPEGARIDASNPDAWSFPIGTRFWKEFSFGRRVETRLIERLPDGTWRFAAYRWRADGSDAELADERGVPFAHEIREGVHHAIPGRQDCAACHGDRATPILGFSALQLSPDRDPLAPHAETLPAGAVTLTTLRAEGRLAHHTHDDAPPRIRASTPRERAALGYLHANCGTCHGSNASLGSLGLSFEWSLATPRDASPAALVTTVGVPSRFRPREDPLAVDRVSREGPGRSVLVHRMSSRSPLSQMPPLGTRLVDDEGLTLVKGWLAEAVVAQTPQTPTIAPAPPPRPAGTAAPIAKGPASKPPLPE